MNLTSDTLLDAMIALTVISVALTVWLWPRLAGRGLLWILARLGMILMSQVSLVLVVALMVNSYGDFYPTWQDLVGGGGNQQVAFGQTSGGAGTAVNGVIGGKLLVPVPGGADSVKDMPKGPADQVGQLSEVRLYGKSSHLDALAYVYLPAQYFQPAYAHTAFPVITAYPGYPGWVQQLVQRMSLPEQVASMEMQGKMQPTILVLVSENVVAPRDTDCVNVVKGPQVDTFMSTDYAAAIRSGLRVTDDPRGWGLTGYSEGGTCALELAMRHPDLFGVVGDMGGDYSDLEDGESGNLFGPKGSRSRAELMQQYNIAWRLAHLPVPSIQVLVATTEKESDYKATQAFLQEVRAPMTATPMFLKVGGHNFGPWTQERDPELVWMSQHMAPPVAVTTPTPPPTRTPPAKGATQGPAKGAGTATRGALADGPETDARR